MVLPLSREWNEPPFSAIGATWLKALWQCRKAVLEAHQQIAAANEKAVRDQGAGLTVGAIVALRRNKDDRKAEGKMASHFTGPFEIVKVFPSGVTAEIRCVETGTCHTVNRARLKLLHAAPKYHAQAPVMPVARYN